MKLNSITSLYFETEVMSIDKYNFGNLIRQERIIKDISYKKLSEITGLTIRSIQYWEKGETSISLENADKILKALGIAIKVGNTENEFIKQTN